MTELDFSQQRAALSCAEELRLMAASAEDCGYTGDIYGAGGTLNEFEKEVAGLLGKEAACFCTSGTGAQQAALRAVVAERPGHVAMHPTCHIAWLDCLNDGEDLSRGFDAAVAVNMLGLAATPIGEAHRALSFEDVRRGVEDVQPKPSAVVIELGQRMNGGAAIAVEELRQASELCRRQGVWLHMDGARLWEATPGYGVSWAELSAYFDSVYVSFYKGLGAVSGAMLLGPGSFVQAAQKWVRRLGTVPFGYAPAAISARARFLECRDSFPERLSQLRELVVAAQALGDERLRFDPPVPFSCLVHVYVKGELADLEAAHERMNKACGARLWRRLRGCGHTVAHGRGGEQYFEWSMGPYNAALPKESFVEAWRLLLAELPQ